jgi:putative transposase
MILALIDEAVASGARLESTCKELGLDARTIQRWRKTPSSDDRRRGPMSKPANALTAKEEREVLEILNSPEYSALSPHQVVAKLADMDIYKASERTMYRLLHRHKLSNHRERSRPRSRHRPIERRARGPNQAWAWDITFLRSPIRGAFWMLYLIVDVWSRKIVGWEVHDRESDQLASELFRGTCEREGIQPGQLTSHSDNGSAMKGKTLLATLQWLGIVPSFSRPHVSDDNPFPEALFRTLKYRPAFPARPFETLAAARDWVRSFVRWYNDDHQHSGISFVTPSQRHAEQDFAILANRRRVYARARQRHPNRWVRNSRAWAHVEMVVLNPATHQGPAHRRELLPASALEDHTGR